MRDRRQRPYRPIRTPSRIEGPQNERLLFVVLQEVRPIEQAQNGATDFSARQRSITHVLPPHRERREMPVVRAGDAGAIRVRRLMTGRTIQRHDTLVLRAADHVRDVTMPIVTLLRIVRCRVAIEATRRHHDRIDPLPGGETIGSSGRQHDLPESWRRPRVLCDGKHDQDER